MSECEDSPQTARGWLGWWDAEQWSNTWVLLGGILLGFMSHWEEKSGQFTATGLPWLLLIALWSPKAIAGTS